MGKTFIARQSITINASVASVWDALVNPVMIKQYLLGTEALSDWKLGSPLISGVFARARRMKIKAQSFR